MKTLECHLLGHLRHSRHSYFHHRQPNGQLPCLMVAVAVTSELTASPIAVAIQEGVHFFFQDRSQHLPNSLTNVILQDLLDLIPILQSFLLLV